MTARTLVLTMFAVLACAAPATAKGLGDVAICGAEGCRDVTGQATHAVLEPGSEGAAPPAPGQPWFDVRVSIEHEQEVMDRWTVRWVPEARLMRGPDGVWTTAPAAAQVELAELSRGLVPHGRRAKAEDDGGPPALAIAAPAALLLLGGAALARRRRRRH